MTDIEFNEDSIFAEVNESEDSIYEESTADTEATKKSFQGFVDRAKEIIGDTDKVKKVLSKAKKLFERLNNLPFLGKYMDDVATLCDMIGDYIDKTYTELPVSTIIGVLASILYFVAPIDAIPDALVGLGIVDDIGVLGLVIQTACKDIDKYRVWKEEQVANEL